MKRFISAIATAILAIGAASFFTLPSAQAQPAICLNLEPGAHDLVVPSQEREGNITFRVEVGEGGVLTEFYEPGGQPIGAGAFMGIFVRGDYELPEGVSVIECGASDDSMMGEDDSPAGDVVCVNLPAGSHSGTVSAGGRSYEITVHVDDNHVVTSVDVLGQSYSGPDALGLLAGFGATLPPEIQIIECPTDADTMSEASDDHGQAVYPTTGTGGLADSADRTALWAGLGALGAIAIAAAGFTQRRRVKVRNKEERR